MTNLKKPVETRARRPNQEQLFEVASGQQGYFTSPQAAAAGYSRSLLSHHSKGGRFVRIRQGIYRLRQYPTSPTEEVVAAWLAVGDASVVSHESALGLLQLVDTIPDQVHLTIPRAKRYQKASPGIKIHTTTRPLAKEEVITRDGISITSATRSILDFAEAGGAPDQVRRAISLALQKGLISRAGLIGAARQRSDRVERLISLSLAESTA